MHRSSAPIWRVALAAALAVLALSVPSIASAEIDASGKPLRPRQVSCTIGGATVALDIDRAVVLTGGRVKATLVATGDATAPVAVEISTLHSENHAGDPADISPVRIAHQIVHLTPGPAGGPPVVVALALGKRPARRAWLDQFAIFIAAPGSPLPDEPIEWMHTGGFWQILSNGDVAAVPVLGWSGNTLDLKLETSPVALGAPFTVTVRLTNASGRALPRDFQVTLTIHDEDGPLPTGFGISEIEDPADPDSGPTAWPARARHVVRFKVVPRVPTRHMVVLATALVHEPAKLGPAIVAGAIEAVAFDAAGPPDPAP